MGVDIVAILEHKYTAKEVFQLTETINTWEEVFQYHLKFNADNKEDIEAKWEAGMFKVDEQLIEKEWIAWETNGKVEAYPKIYCSFADFRVNRNTINICPSWMHKYGNLYSFNTREYVLNLMRMIARKIGSTKILYCPDSACSTSIMEEFSNKGWELNDIEEYGYSEFGKIPKDLTKAIYNYFFIDDLKMNLEDYNNEKFLFNRCNEEYFLQQKFGEKMIIKRK